METIEAKIRECGNGFPDVGDLIPGTDDELYRLVSWVGSIQTGAPGAGNWCLGMVEWVGWDDCGDEEPSDAIAIIPAADEGDDR